MTDGERSRNLQLAAAIASCLFCSTAMSADEQTDQLTPHQVDPSYDSNPETSSIGRSENVESKLSAEFADFLGNEDRSSRVVEGLRTGDEFRLGGGHQDGDGVGHHQTDSQTTSVDGAHNQPPPPDGGYDHQTIDPPTGTMGYGNVRLTLNLAEARLTQLGINQPTNSELSAILVGGEIGGVHVEGILNDRAAGAGWGEIAQRYDLKVGQLMGKEKVSETVVMPHDGSGHHVRPTTENQLSSTSTEKSNKARIGQSSRHSYRSNGYIPSGKVGTSSSAKIYGPNGTGAEKHAARRNGYIPSGSSAVTTSANRGHAGIVGAKGNGVKKNGYIPSGSSPGRGAGIVSAQGAGTTNQGAIKSGHARGHTKGYVPSGAGHSAGVISASNASVSSSVHSAAARGHGKGHAKKK